MSATNSNSCDFLSIIGVGPSKKRKKKQATRIQKSLSTADPLISYQHNTPTCAFSLGCDMSQLASPAALSLIPLYGKLIMSSQI
jgi:hypothetical protein